MAFATCCGVRRPAPLRRCQPGARVHRRHRRRRAAHVRGDGRRGQPRGPPHGTRPRARPSHDPGRPRPSADALHDRVGAALLKGKERAVIAEHVIAVAGTRPRELPDATPTVGREAELAAFAEAVNAARTRQLQVIELVGEPGMGKSRLVDELRRLALRVPTARGSRRAVRRKRADAALRPLLRQLVGVRPMPRARKRGQSWRRSCKRRCLTSHRGCP